MWIKPCSLKSGEFRRYDVMIEPKDKNKAPRYVVPVKVTVPEKTEK
ncbi:MAG: hypothetical protein J6K04_02605 [Lachnospiraceae bacterium]|nr:hypothetical protein [Lachnospiraceae bacterium]